MGKKEECGGDATTVDQVQESTQLKKDSVESSNLMQESQFSPMRRVSQAK